ncbi:MAG: hypothetical protein KatS3mg103_0498 [Phycisphaerales bacterium]|nr:MAG: hypothetical protein KatS3mg103_0498 [Phycisphaerales bacterium]
MGARQRRSRVDRAAGGASRAGFVLLDLVVALALFVVGGLAVLAQLESGTRRVIDAEHRLGALGVARTALGLLEAGALSDRELTGPAEDWLGGSIEGGPGPGPAGASGVADRAWWWYCQVDLEPSSWPELTLATVTVRRVPAQGQPEEQPVLARLVQLVPADGAWGQQEDGREAGVPEARDAAGTRDAAGARLGSSASRGGVR